MKSKKHNKYAAWQKYQCAYSGKHLGDKFQLDHATPVSRGGLGLDYNMKACLTIVNHYKRGRTLEEFREYMLTFHLRLVKLPKKTQNNKTRKRIEYMRKIAWAFNIEVDKPFDGKFHFEKFNYTRKLMRAVYSTQHAAHEGFLTRYRDFTEKMRNLYWFPAWDLAKQPVINQISLGNESS